MQPPESNQLAAVNSRQTLQGTDMDIKELAPALAHRTCNRYKHGDEWPYQFTEQGVIDFATRLIAAYLAEQEEVVRVVDGGGELHLPKLQWVSANHSLETPIGSKLFTAPPLPAIPDERIAILEQQVAALTKERNALQDKLNAVVTVGIREREQLVAAQAREAKLQGKLFHFGRHHSNCGWQMNRPCNCGFDEALANPATIPELCALLEKAEEDLVFARQVLSDHRIAYISEALAAIKQWKEQT